eukprot:771383-Pleurochrysis_carterae.AAC.3
MARCTCDMHLRVRREERGGGLDSRSDQTMDPWRSQQGRSPLESDRFPSSSLVELMCQRADS